MALTNQDLPVKPYTCHTCNRSFSRSDLYENHLLTRFHIKRVNGFVPVSVNLSASKPPRPVPQQSKLPPSRQLTPLTPVPPRPDYNNPRIPFTTSQQCYKPLSDLEQFSLSNSSAPSSSSSTPSPPSTSLPPLPFDSSTFYSCSFAQVSSPQLPTHNTLLGNPFAFFFTEDTLSSENALNAFQSVSHYHLSALTTFPSQPLETLQSHTYQINSTTARLLNQYLSFSGHIYDFSTHELSNFIKAAWLNHEYLNFVLHRPTFLANSADLPLLATLAFLGIYCVNSQHSHLIPLYNNLKGKHAIELQKTRGKGFLSNLTLMQSCSLLVWRNFVRSSSEIGAHIVSDPNYMFIEALISTAGLYLKLGGTFTPQQNTRIYYQNASVDSYQFSFQETFAQNVMDQQWHTWIQHESCIRVLHFLMFTCKQRLAITKQGHIYPFVDFDVPMTSPDCLWQASSTVMFFHTVGPTRTIRTLSYILILKSMLRMPRLTEYGTKSVKLCGTSDKTTWTLGPYVVVLYGLATIAWGVGAGSPDLFDAIQRALDKQYDPTTSTFRRPLDLNGNFVADRGLQSRIFYAFEMLEVLCERTTRKFDEADFTPYLNALSGHPNVGEPFGTRNALTHIALEQGSPPPWLCTVAGCLHFQLCYFSLYRDTPFINDLVTALPSRLPRVAEYMQSHTKDETEHFLLFGENDQVFGNYHQYYRWIHHDRTENCIAIATYFMINLVAAKNSVGFGGLEASVIRELLFHSLISLWTWDYSIREQTKQPLQHAEIPFYLLEFWTNCGGLAAVPESKRGLIEQSLGFLLGIWQQTRKSFIDPAEKFARRYDPSPAVTAPTSVGLVTQRGQRALRPDAEPENAYEHKQTFNSHAYHNNSYHNQHKQAYHNQLPLSPSLNNGAGPCMEIFLYLDSTLRLDSSEPLNTTLCRLADFASVF